MATLTKMSDARGCSMIRVMPPKGNLMRKMNVAFVVDVSGSMSSSVDPNGSEHTKYYSSLDIAAQGVKAAIASIGSTGRGSKASLVSFSDVATVQHPMTELDFAGEGSIAAAATGMVTQGSTALFKGVMEGLGTLPAEEEGVLNAVVVITDGFPTISPPEGDVAAIRNLEHTAFMLFIGLGFDMDSNLLMDMSNATNDATFVHCGGADMLLTTMINGMASLSNTFATSAYLTINGIRHSLGRLEYGLDRDVLVDNLTDDVFLEYRNVGGTTVKVSLSANIVDGVAVQSERLRIIGVDILKKVLRTARIDAPTTLKDIGENVEKMLVSSVSNAFVADLLGEVVGAVKNWDRWGQHYIRSLLTAHERAYCPNFKDKAPNEMYRTKNFDAFVTLANGVCASLSPPKMSLLYGRPTVVTTSQNFTQDFYNSEGGCFSPHAFIRLADGRSKHAENIVKGDVLVGGTVVCVVMTKDCTTVSFTTPLGTRKNLTPWHPYVSDGVWSFPANTAFGEMVEHPVVYNFVLEGGNTCIVDGLVACTLGHGIEGPVIGHELYGTQKIVDALKKINGWDAGRVWYI